MHRIKVSYTQSVILLNIEDIIAPEQHFLELVHHLAAHDFLDCGEEDVHGAVEVAERASEEGVVVVEFDLDGAAEELLDEIGWTSLPAHNYIYQPSN